MLGPPPRHFHAASRKGAADRTKPKLERQRRPRDQEGERGVAEKEDDEEGRRGGEKRRGEEEREGRRSRRKRRKMMTKRTRQTRGTGKLKKKAVK